MLRRLVRKTDLLRPRRSRLLRWPSVGATILLASCKPAGLLDPQGPIASAERLLLINSTAIMLVVVIPVIVATLAFAWWYRASNAHATRSLGTPTGPRIVRGASELIASRSHNSSVWPYRFADDSSERGQARSSLVQRGPVFASKALN
jgi:hypothetical protein